ncbi:MAG: GxxExxY protein [Nanoarchaeota archaeon]|nr:GxxExxY protein [Nanoarchaeota archaeon]
MIPLELPIENLPRISKYFVSKFKRMGVKTIHDLLYHFPARYEDFSEIRSICDLIPNETATIQGKVKTIKTRQAWKRRRMQITEATVKDGSGEIQIIWFNQSYVAHQLAPGTPISISGKIFASHDKLQMKNPTFEVLHDWKTETTHTAKVVATYPETQGLTSKGIRHFIDLVLHGLPNIEDPLPNEILHKLGFPKINEALKNIHQPETIEDGLRAGRRFSFEDLFYLQLFNLQEKQKLKEEHASEIPIKIENIKTLLETLPFDLTPSQKTALWEIVQNMGRDHPMNRLLQGDVGSGKTIVVAVAALLAAEEGFQIAFMTPTEILARQHFETMKKFFPKTEVGLSLLTSSESRAYYGENLEHETKKSELKKEIESGAVKIIFGTHALLQKDVSFKNLALIIIDEQHRFGVRQRAALIRRSTQIETQINADKEFPSKELTYAIRGACFEVFNTIGSGFKETIYQRALEEEFKKRKLSFEKEKTLTIQYEGKNVGTYRPDFVISEQVILETKALPFIGKIEEKQAWHYLRGSEYKVLLLINFGKEKLDMKRIIYDTARNNTQNLRESASHLRESASLPHFLSMSATPIPRTLSLTLWSDLDLSLITELPKNRQPITTKVIPPEKRDDAYAFIRDEVKKGRQVFVVCPRIERSEDAHPEQGEGHPYSWISDIQTLNVKSVKEEYEKLSKKIFPDLKVKMLHGKMKPKEKEEVMRKFKDGELDILVSTSVIEVGVDVPNATIMMIESAERFGLAQLYQFRGRVGRGAHKSHCLLFTESSSKSTALRLRAIEKAKNGMELAEYDLKQRGPGEFLGEVQTGMPDLAMKALQHPDLVKEARYVAKELLEKDQGLENHPLLKEHLKTFESRIHWE